MTNSDGLAAYQELEQNFRRLSLLGNAQGLLSWDWAVMMPEGSAAARADEMAEMGLLRHEMTTDPALSDRLDRAEAEQDSLNPWQQANLAEMRRSWRHANAVPADLVSALSKAGTECEMVWRTARAANDFAAVRPHLERVLELAREKAVAKGAAFGCDPYDSLIDQFEPGGRAAAIDPIFEELGTFLPDFTAAVLDHQASQPDLPQMQGPFPIAAQKKLG